MDRAARKAEIACSEPWCKNSLETKALRNRTCRPSKQRVRASELLASVPQHVRSMTQVTHLHLIEVPGGLKKPSANIEKPSILLQRSRPAGSSWLVPMTVRTMFAVTFATPCCTTFFRCATS